MDISVSVPVIKEGSKLKRSLYSLLKRHQHQWQANAQSEYEQDLGLGMMPAKICDLKCNVCGVSAIQTVHPFYGTHIEIVTK